MNFSRKMLLMIILNVAKNQVSLCMMYLEDTLCVFFFVGAGAELIPPVVLWLTLLFFHSFQ